MVKIIKHNYNEIEGQDVFVITQFVGHPVPVFSIDVALTLIVSKLDSTSVVQYPHAGVYPGMSLLKQIVSTLS